MSNLHNTYFKISKSFFGRIIQRSMCFPPSIILGYHGVQSINHSNCVSVESFKEQMLYIKENFNVLPLHDLVEKNKNEKNLPSVAITFDDAYCNLLENALPILSDLNLPATIYVPLGYIGKKNEWDSLGHEQMLPIMSQEDLEYLVNNEDLIFIGSHTVNHSRLANLTSDQLLYEIRESKKGLEKKLGIDIDSIAYPHGSRLDYNSNVIDAVQKEGYHFALSTNFGRYFDEKEKWCLSRVRVWGSDDLERFKMKLHGNYDWLRLKEYMSYVLKKVINI